MNLHCFISLIRSSGNLFCLLSGTLSTLSLIWKCRCLGLVNMHTHAKNYQNIKCSLKVIAIFTNLLYPRHTMYVEGNLVFVFPSVRPCVRPYEC